jgi:hypothetical protein
MNAAPPPSRYRTLTGATSLILAPAFMSAGDLMHPHESWDATAQVAMVAESASRWYVAHLCCSLECSCLSPVSSR